MKTYANPKNCSVGKCIKPGKLCNSSSCDVIIKYKIMGKVLQDPLLKPEPNKIDDIF